MLREGYTKVPYSSVLRNSIERAAAGWQLSVRADSFLQLQSHFRRASLLFVGSGGNYLPIK